VVGSSAVPPISAVVGLTTEGPANRHEAVSLTKFGSP
jgi:hypothetical protein